MSGLFFSDWTWSFFSYMVCHWPSTVALNTVAVLFLSSLPLQPTTRTDYCSSLSLPSSLCRRLHSNNLHCDCHLSWLSDWLRQRRGLAPFTQCMAPANMRGLNIPDVQKKDFTCTGTLNPNDNTLYYKH